MISEDLFLMSSVFEQGNVAKLGKTNIITL
jgi:hypothetical protein